MTRVLVFVTSGQSGDQGSGFREQRFGFGDRGAGFRTRRRLFVFSVLLVDPLVPVWCLRLCLLGVCAESPIQEYQLGGCTLYVIRHMICLNIHMY